MDSDILAHYGTKRHSGRYPWGSGKDPYQSAQGFLAERDKLKAQGIEWIDIKLMISVRSNQAMAGHGKNGTYLPASR